MRLIVFLSVLLMATGVFAEIKIPSRFGITLSLPDNWRLLTSSESDTGESTAAQKNNSKVQGMADLSKKMREGGLELIFNTQKIEGAEGFYDNITLLETYDQVPEAAGQIKSTCGALPSLLSHTLGRSVQLDRCEGKLIQNYPAFVLSYAGDVQNTRILQYMLQLEQNRSLVLTLTYHTKNTQVVADFETALQQLEVNDLL